LVKLGLTYCLQVFAKFGTSMDYHALLRRFLFSFLQDLVKTKLFNPGQTWFDRQHCLPAISLQVFAKFDTSMEQLEPLSAELNVKALPVFRFYKVRHF
jgi:hypothetical protein